MQCIDSIAALAEAAGEAADPWSGLVSFMEQVGGYHPLPGPALTPDAGGEEKAMRHRAPRHHWHFSGRIASACCSCLLHMHVHAQGVNNNPVCNR